MRNSLIVIGLLGFFTWDSGAEVVTPVLAPDLTRPWPGADWWANPWEDWQLRGGRLENTFPGGDRNVVILTAELSDRAAPFTVAARVDQLSFELRGDGFVGFELGLHGAADDFRDAAVRGSGLAAGVDARGRLFIGSPRDDAPRLDLPLRNLTLELKGDPRGDAFRLSLRAHQGGGKTLGEVSVDAVHPSWLAGLVALASSSQPPSLADPASPRPAAFAGIPQERGGDLRFAFDQVVLGGDKIIARPERALGPVLWTTHTRANDGTLNLLVQAAPFGLREELEARLELEGKEPRFARLDPVSRTALFKLRKLDPKRAYPFTVHLEKSVWKGTVAAVPDGSRPLVVASLACDDSSGFPHNDLVANVASHQPALITFLGDQVYETTGGYDAIYDQHSNDRATLSYLRKYALHGWTWRELLRDVPSVTLPGEHDVFHVNLWGAGGKAADVSRGFGATAQDSGGYKMSVEFVNMVHLTQTGSLPDPAELAPCDSGISVYFTRLLYGPLDLAIVADRQFKSAPAALLPDAKIVNGWPQNTGHDAARDADVETAQLLGARQESFLERWAANRNESSPCRVVLSRSPWIAAHTLPASVNDDSGLPSLPLCKPGEVPADDEPKPDYGSNGWPQSKRAKALRLLLKAKAIHLTGGNNLATTGRYGLGGFADGPWWVGTPATGNPWPRRWMPSAAGQDHRPGDPRWTGGFSDAFGNKFTMHAAANPLQTGREPARVFDRAVGYTITTWDRAAGRVAIAAWPYRASPAKPGADAKPFPGWPLQVDLKTLGRVE